MFRGHGLETRPYAGYSTPGFPVTQSIFSHIYPNGLVLVAEPMHVAAIGGVHVPGARPAASTIRPIAAA